MLNVILACDSSFGIGLKGRLPWYDKKELQLFKSITVNSVLIVGRKTAETLPTLSNRIVLTVSRSPDSVRSLALPCFPSLEQALQFSNEHYTNKQVFIIGGAFLYEYTFTNQYQIIDKVYFSSFKQSYECDTYFKLFQFLNPADFVIEKEEDYETFTHLVYAKKKNNEEQAYLHLLQSVMREGGYRQTRNAKVYSLFYKHLTFNLQNGFPLLTTKKMFLKGIVEELLFFLRGETNSKKLEEKGVNIWKGNTNSSFLQSIGKQNRVEGMMGPMYGYQWRFFNRPYDETTGTPIDSQDATVCDQLQHVIDLIKNDPYSRRILLTTYNPLQADDGVLYPCHSIVNQFYVVENEETKTKYLDMSVYNRSQDLFLGTPFNIASSALLLTIIAKCTNLQPRYLHMTLGDVHIYETHKQAVEQQIQRVPFAFPTLTIDKSLRTMKDIEGLSFADFILSHYKSYPVIKADMIS
jgi:thymidylate synthase